MSKRKKFTQSAMKINNRIGRAIRQYKLVENGDRILLAVSGGKDSLTLMQILKKIQTWAPIRFEVIAAHIKTDFHCASCMHEKILTKLFEEARIEYVYKNIKVLDENNKTNCFWCSWSRRKALFETANELRCNKVAFGHHKDDIVETVLMNLIFKGNVSTMNPKQELFGGKITLIRPLCYVEESLIIQYAEENRLPSKLCRCPFGQHSRRKIIKNFINETQKNTGDMNIRTNIFNSLSRIRSAYVDLRSEVV